MFVFLSSATDYSHSSDSIKIFPVNDLHTDKSLVQNVFGWSCLDKSS